MDARLMYIVTGIGVLTLGAAFWRMKTGFGPFNLRVVGLVLIATFATLLATADGSSLTAALGILGAIAGYLFGFSIPKETGSKETSSVDIGSSNIGQGSKIAGRDINETIENLNTQVAHINSQINQIQRAVSVSTDPARRTLNYLINTIYEREQGKQKQALEHVISKWENQGWKLLGLSSDYNGTDGMFLLFCRPSDAGQPKLIYYHGSEMERVL